MSNMYFENKLTKNSEINIDYLEELLKEKLI